MNAPSFFHAVARGALVLAAAWALQGARVQERAGAPQVAGFKRLRTNAQGRLEYRHLKTGLVFVLLPGGEFQMGSPPGETGRYAPEGPVHRVRVQPFLLCKTEVPQAVWKKLMPIVPWQGKPYVHRGDDYAASNLSWNDGEAFCKTSGLRLPSEAEWEYACRAGSTTRYSFGDDEAKLPGYAWFDRNTWDRFERHAHRVAQKKPNPFGLHDMHGNVWEWCADTWHDSYEGAPDDGRPWIDPDQTDHVIRGGGWLYDAWNCRSASRIRNDPAFRNDDQGLRPAASLK